MKRTLSILLVLTLLLGMSVPAFADEEGGQQLGNAIKAVKAAIDIPDSYSDFEYHSWQEDGRNVWTLIWNKSDDNASSITANVDADYNLTSFSRSYSNQDKSGLGKVTADEGRKTAEAFLAKALPEKYKDFRFKSQSGSYGYLSYDYGIYVNDVPLSYVNTSVTVDLYSGDIDSYYCYDESAYTTKAINAADFPSKEKAIKTREAAEKFLDKIGVKLCYITKFDYDKKTISTFPAYVLEDDGRYIDALTGDIVASQKYYGYAGLQNEDASDSGGGSRDYFSPAEQSAVDNASSMLSQDEAVKIVAKYISNISSNSKVLNKSISKNYFEKDKYTLYLDFEDASASLNAMTGELLSYYDYDYFYDNESKNKGGITKEKAKNIADSFLKSVAGDKYELMLLDDTDRDYGSDSGYYSFSYIRQVNGIDYTGNGAYISVSKADGKVAYYNMTWYDGVAFKPLDGAISEWDALGVFMDEGFDLRYVITVDNNIALVYGFDDNISFMVDPFGSDKINSRGEAYRDENTIQSYGDISGKWYEKTVKMLLDNGYYLNSADGNFHGGDRITQESFLRYLYAPSQAYYNSNDFYEWMKNTGVIEDGEKNPNANVSRADAARFMVRYMGLEKAGEHTDIYKNMFKDKVPAGYEGYAALAKAFGIMNGDAKGRFNGSSYLTNAEAAVIIYNTLNLEKN